MFKSFRLFAAVGIFLFFAGALLSAGASVRSPLPWEAGRYAASKHLFNKKQLAHMHKRAVATAAILEQDGDLPTKDTELSNFFRKSSLLEIAPTVSLQSARAHSTLRLVFAPKVSMQILQSVLML